MFPSSDLIKSHIMGLYLLKGYVDTWLMSLAPTIGESAGSRKSKTAKPKNNLVFKETCGLWKHKTSLRKRILCSAMLAEKNLLWKGESCKLFVTFVTYKIVCLVTSTSACGEGDFGPIWLTMTHSSACVCALLSHICNDLLPREP